MVGRSRNSEAATTIRECRLALAARGGTILREVTGARAAEPVEWQHYPEGEVYDPDSHAQYFFHRHPAPDSGNGETPSEHGHFHLFLRGEGMPTGITPLLLPEVAVANAPLPRQSAPLKRGNRSEVCHLVAIAVDARGEPIKLFTTNRWVTGETWYGADDVIRMLARFRIEGDHPLALVNRWIGAIVQLFEADIAELLQARDDAVRERRWRWRSDVLEDPRLEVASTLAIDLDARLAAVERSGDRGLSAASRRLRLPRMAEGWGA